MISPTEIVLSKLPDVWPCGKGWSACCPGHEDRTPSLSIAEGEDGRVMIHCHAGCSPESIVESMGLRMADLMPPTGVNVNETSPFPARNEVALTDKANETTQKYATAKEAVSALEARLGPRSAWWTYHDATGQPIGLIARWDRSDGGKNIRPVSRSGEGWIVGGMVAPRPLYRLPELAAAKRIFVTEGEKAAEAARSIGLAATTSPHGAKSARKADWAPLAGKEVIVLPDNDGAGHEYGQTVVTCLQKLSPVPTVKIVELPGLPQGGDIVDWIHTHDQGTSSEELRRRVENMADQAETVAPVMAEPPCLQYQPFPVDALPEPVRRFVVAGAVAIGCDSSYVALPMLTVLAAAIGNTRRLQLKRGWTAPPIIWVAIVGESGTAKSPAFKLVMRPLRERQRQALERHEETMRQHRMDLALFEKELSEWKKIKNSTQPPPEKPLEPLAERFVVSDTTMEALAPILLGNPRGVLLARDELAGWIGSFDRYSGGKGGADAAHWLSMFNAENLVVDRKTGSPRTIYVPAAAVCVCGGIQPAILNRALGSEHRESGLAARLLLTCPPRKPKRWTEADIDPAIERQVAIVIEMLYSLQPEIDGQGQPCPAIVQLSPDAKAVWTAFYNSHAREQADLVGELSAVWSKMEEYAARLALVVHLARAAAGDPTLSDPDTLDSASMESGVRLVAWFKDEARRVSNLLSESDEDRSRRRLTEWIARRGGAVTAREVQQNYRALRAAGAAEAALNDLVAAGYGIWRPVDTTEKGGRPTRAFQLTGVSTVNDTPLDAAEEVGSVDVDGVGASESEMTTDDGWGEI